MIPDYICVPIGYLKTLTLANILTYFALVLAFLAYRKNVQDKHASWKVLLNAFKSELEAQKDWLSTPYSENHEDKAFYNPSRIVFKISFESAKEIARLGISLFNRIDTELNTEVAQFNQRVATFNALLEYHRNLLTSNILLAQILTDKLKSIGMLDGNVTFKQFVDELEKLQNGSDEDRKMFLLSKQAYRLNIILHATIIGNESIPFSLHYLYKRLRNKIDAISTNYDKNVPWYTKTLGLVIIVVFSIAVLLLLAVVFHGT